MAEGFVFLVFYIHISIQWEDTEVNWNPLKPDEVAFIAASIKYDKLQCKAGELYSQIATLDCLLENKVKFILQHWGWNGLHRAESNYIISAIKDTGLPIPENIKTFYEQLYSLIFPIKKEKIPIDKYGGALRLRLSEESDILLKDWLIGAKCLSARFNDDIFPIGYRLNYNGFSPRQVDGWENPFYCPSGAWSYELHLGNSGRVYIWDTEVSDYIGIEADDVLSFFASAFGLIPDTERSAGYTSDIDFERMESIEKLWSQEQN